MKTLVSGSASRRVRALLTCGILLGTSAVGTAALWSTSSATVSGQFSTASLAIQANGSVAHTFTFPGTLLPGDTTAAVINVQNTGSIPLVYNASVSSSSALGTAMTLTARSGGTLGSGSVSGTTVCTGGAQVALNVAITATAAAFSSGRGPLAPATGTESLCVQLTLPTSADAALAGTSGTVTFTFDAIGS